MIMKLKHLNYLFILLSLSFGLFGCSAKTSEPVNDTNNISQADYSSDVSEEYISEMTFSSDEEFWETAEKMYPLTSFDDISERKKTWEIVKVDALFLGSKEINNFTKEYLIAYQVSDGSYKCYSTNLDSHFNNLMTDMSVLDNLKKGYKIRICTYIQNSNYVDFNTMYGLKVIGHDDEAAKIALNISDNPLLNLKKETARVMSGSGTLSLGEYAFFRMNKDDMRNISMEQFKEFVDTRVNNSGYNWCSIIFTDGTGIVWEGSIPEYASYGKLSTDDNHIIEYYGDITWDYDKETYSYVSKK